MLSLFPSNPPHPHLNMVVTCVGTAIGVQSKLCSRVIVSVTHRRGVHDILISVPSIHHDPLTSIADWQANYTQRSRRTVYFVNINFILTLDHPIQDILQLYSEQLDFLESIW
jgi:hypothetical protein